MRAHPVPQLALLAALVQACHSHWTLPLRLGNKIQVEFMKEQGYLNKRHNRRRDEFVSYVEAHAKMQLLIKGPTTTGH